MTETPVCRICKSSKWVAIWHEKHREEAICVECCGGDVGHSDGETGHSFKYEPGLGLSCVYCGSQDFPNDYYAE